ncbi:MAG: sulfurtransferase [Candidatus Muproteobacteria bacterium RIFCSPHIGHO2_02_FULL_60_13]|uniref:Sulfurtransferase n=1 Tax=Candidatus Muproteobacteria bacterium RIFCSPLOWO2_01_FULL_60_18 TaxID=1817768 RepID=A0A1F6U4Z8_9PROT|nr:MAG: sulfurtransferase [Candidatus Muproteobacteria bacterium RIFCSPLOWO2_01_FULL_60_18]OGI56586.1 MAG: sulfurtransferase [Candidatus Muproteobacteria bacterium RIFCSPHIGHO2_02_FULL_60_13]
MRQLSVRELKERLDKKSDKLVVLDVREPWERNICALPEAVTIPMREVPARAAELPKDANIVVVCHHGIRSQQVALYLERVGFDKLNNVVGGIDAWAREIDPKMQTY